ncbi:uncharacterized protein LOC109827694 isoform X2 [Asparagus officinalis]|uniref:uncharacterized protein LOC109827694 isoform X2 n=1 Tax=Asparagus officinalis TaxID=4686 RepID=UPI00098E738F|nr:uncharacterized protein LOC109827694 isoform X2 [Asparagus officinalis]XP_020250294.1 uncharacterized protein LOC109827694 isoform X2 [Asparagus officinalis]XP_020250295.1 uncharacterized protein LOC109827694 isoform X2 [Asparagus officinalis]
MESLRLTFVCVGFWVVLELQDDGKLATSDYPPVVLGCSDARNEKMMKTCSSISVLPRPPLSISQMSNKARWSVMQSYNLLKYHKRAHRAAVKALESKHSLGVVIRRIEEAMSSHS